MAQVYRVVDTANGRRLALKQLMIEAHPQRRRDIEPLFEREFRTLAQLSHPRVISVFDYGVDPRGPFYTMELLDGSDLQQRSPLPFREACSLMFDVCSSLALLHARRLLHRDVSPRNIRCTEDGHAKLIDFGVMADMGRAEHLVGTAAFVAPEALARVELDARTDLYSVGATLYYALTGQPPYPAREFAQLPEAWQRRPAPPSSHVPEITASLDALVMSLLSLDPALRPRTAFEVMQRLAGSAQLERSESGAVAQAYVTAPSLIGRERELSFVRTQLKACRSGSGAALLFRGEAGIGRTRMLEACAVEAKTFGCAVISAGADAAGVGGFALADALVEQLGTVLFELARETAASEPELAGLFGAGAVGDKPRRLGELGVQRPLLQAALSRWLLSISRRQLLVIAVDDADRADEASVALLAALAHGASRKRLLVLCSAAVPASEHAAGAFSVLAESCEARLLEQLSLVQVEALLGSIFGDVPNLQLLSARFHASAAGNPRDCMDLVRHLLDRGPIHYERGNWTLPAELQPLDLPNSAEDAFEQRLVGLSTTAHALISAQALASHAAFTLDDYAALLGGADVACLDGAIAELIARDVLTRNGTLYAFRRATTAHTLSARLTDEVRATKHRALARLYDQRGLRAIAVKHLLRAGEHEAALEQLAEVARSHANAENLSAVTRLSAGEIAEIFEQALPLALAKGTRPPREIAEIRHWLVMLSSGAEDRHYTEHAAAWLVQLEHDSGLALWRTLGELAPSDRLMRALGATNERYQATPEAERVYSPIEAIQFLAHYVAVSLVLGSRTNDASLLCRLPDLIEPFAPLAPLLDAVWRNAMGARDAAALGRVQSGRAHWLDAFERLERVTGPEAVVARYIRNAIGYAIGLLDASSGLESAVVWADLLDRDPLQAVNAMYLRKIVRLTRGDIAGAERFRRQAELLEVQASARPMFTGTLAVELGAHALANDLTGVKQVMDRIAPLAALHPGWVPYLDLAEAHFERLRGNLAGARAALERCLSRPDTKSGERTRLWPSAVGCYVDVLRELGHAEQARACGEQALARCAEHGMDVPAYPIARSVALAEADLGAYTQAAARVEEVIAAQRAFGASGLHIGASYEARTRIAILAKDERAIEQYAQLTAKEYRDGTGTMLIGRYEQLLEDAQRAGVDALPALSELRSTLHVSRVFSLRTPAATSVNRELRAAETPEKRSACALRLICEAAGVHAGQLYLRDASGRLRLAAVLGALQCGDGFEDWVSQSLEAEQNESDQATVLDGDSVGSSVATNTSWTESSGVTVRPLPLACILDGGPRYVGIAALVSRTHRPQVSRELLAAIALQLIRSGDVL
jgi:hypothetical protein